MPSHSSCSEESDLSDVSVHSKSSYRVSVCLRRCFSDVRSRCFILISKKRRVRWLEQRLRKLFALRGLFYLCANGHLLPSSEPLGVLNPDDCVEVVPHDLLEEAVDAINDERKIKNNHCLVIGEDTLDASHVHHSLVTNRVTRKYKSSKVKKNHVESFKQNKENKKEIKGDKVNFQTASNDISDIISTTHEDEVMEDSDSQENLEADIVLEKEKQRALALLDEQLAGVVPAVLPAPVALDIAPPVAPDAAQPVAPDIAPPVAPDVAPHVAPPVAPPVAPDVAPSIMPLDASSVRRRRVRRRRPPRSCRSVSPSSPRDLVPAAASNRNPSLSFIGKPDVSPASSNHSQLPAGFDSISPLLWPATPSDTYFPVLKSTPTCLSLPEPSWAHISCTTAPSSVAAPSCSPTPSVAPVTRNNANCSRKPRLIQPVLEIKNTHITFPV